MSISAAAGLLGVGRKTLQGWLKAGCPRNDDGRVHVPAVFAWRIEHERKLARPADANVPDTLAYWSKEYRKTKTHQAALELEQATQDVVPTAEVEAEFATMADRIKTDLTHIPRSMASILAGRPAADIESELATAIHDCLRHLCGAGLPTGQAGVPPAIAQTT